MNGEVIGHAAVLRALRSLAEAAEPVHALLFAGPEGTGRTRLALEFARLLNCEADPDRRPCGECRACRLIGEGSHPDVVALTPGDAFCRGDGHDSHPDSRDIRICQVRGLIESVSRYPFEGRQRVIIVEPADRLRLEASNTLLKTLEEPPPSTVIVLVTAAPEILIETIRSRCRQVDVGLVPRQEIEEGLVALGHPPEIAARAAAESRRRPAEAIAFAEKPDLMDDRGRLLARCAEIAAARHSDRLRYAEDLADRWRRDRNLVYAELDAWETFWEERLRAAVEAGAEGGPAPAVVALQAVAAARDDLEAQVIARLALDLMLLRFPVVTLDVTATEETAPA